MEKSKLPVLRGHGLNASELSVPAAKKPCPSKTVVPLYSRDPNIAFSSVDQNCVVFKAGGNGRRAVVSKKSGPPARGSNNRYRMESDLKDKIQLLEATNKDLTNAQNTIQEMTEQQKLLKEELKEVQGRLENNLIILESRNIDPVSGELIIAAAEETSKVREETKAFTGNLLKELETFTLETKKQKELIQTAKTKWTAAEESRNLFLQEQEVFQKGLEQFQLSLECAEKWLDL